MKLLHQIGPRINPNFNTLEEILACDEPLSFDGVYVSVYENYKALRGKNITFFVSGKYVGGDNSFDVPNGQPLSKFCTWDQIEEMADYLGAVVGYHGWEHRRCVGLSPSELYMELCRNDHYDSDRRFMDSVFAWPYGDYDQAAITMVSNFYNKAYSAMQGDNSNQFALRRTLLNW